MAKIYTGNEAIDKYLRRNINPNYKINDYGEYWQHYFLSYLLKIGSKEDIQYVMEEYFGEERLLKCKGTNNIIAVIRLGYCLDYFSRNDSYLIRAEVAKQGYKPNLFAHD